MLSEKEFRIFIDRKDFLSTIAVLYASRFYRSVVNHSIVKRFVNNK